MSFQTKPWPVWPERPGKARISITLFDTARITLVCVILYWLGFMFRSSKVGWYASVPLFVGCFVASNFEFEKLLFWYRGNELLLWSLVVGLSVLAFFDARRRFVNGYWFYISSRNMDTLCEWIYKVVWIGNCNTDLKDESKTKNLAHLHALFPKNGTEGNRGRSSSGHDLRLYHGLCNGKLTVGWGDWMDLLVWIWFCLLSAVSIDDAMLRTRHVG